jgi:hypothetical protein
MGQLELHIPKKVWGNRYACVYCSKLAKQVINYPCRIVKEHIRNDKNLH